MAGSTIRPATKKDLQEALKPLATKDQLKALATKKDLRSQTTELKAYAREQTAELAGMIKHGFDEVDERFEAISQRLDVRQQHSPQKNSLSKKPL